MNTSSLVNLHQTALDCVSDMGDVFWDYDSFRHPNSESRDPRDVAADAVEKVLREVVIVAQASNRADAVLRSEYEAIVADLPGDPSDTELVNSLVAKAAWSETGANEIIRLARDYGTSILRNALALAAAMQIEDGSVGL